MHMRYTGVSLKKYIILKELVAVYGTIQKEQKPPVAMKIIFKNESWSYFGIRFLHFFEEQMAR